MQISACQPCDLHGTTNSLDIFHRVASVLVILQLRDLKR